MLVAVALGSVVTVLLAAPAVTLGAAVAPGSEPVPFHHGAAVVTAGLLLAGGADLLVGWIPVAGVLVGPLAWAYAARTLLPADWPTAAVLGAASWGLSVGVYAAFVPGP